ncbi:MAG: PD40 domain-containing protein [Chloroflexi bacterium]|nr:PD40 domain-containing protein [Chloroflexota bacterium]
MSFLGRTLCSVFALILLVSSGGMMFIRALSNPSNTAMILSQREGEGRLYLVGTSTGISQRLTHDHNLVYFVGAASDKAGEWLYFQVQDPQIRFDFAGRPTGRLYRIHPDGTAMQQLGDQRIQVGTIVWTPDRQWLLFLWNRAGFRPSLWAIRADGTDQRNLTDGFNGYIGVQNGPGLFFSPDGTWVAFSGRRQGASNIGVYRVRLDGTDITNLTENFEGHFVLRGWPTQAWMLVVRNGVLYRLQTDGSQLTALSAAEPSNHSDISGWVQNGDLLVASTIQNANSMTGLFALASTDGATPRWILEDAAFVDFTPNQQAVIARRDGGTRLVQVALDGSAIADLVTDPFLEQIWGYTPDHQWLLFTSADNQTGKSNLRRVRLRDGLIQTLHSFDMPIQLRHWDGDEWLVVQSRPSSAQPSTYWQIRPDGSEIHRIYGITNQDIFVRWNVDIEHDGSLGIMLLGSLVLSLSYFAVRHSKNLMELVNGGFPSKN